MAQLTLGEDQNGAEIAVRAGDIVIVRLPENSGGGYRWTLTPVDAARLEMVEHRYEPPRAGVGGVGASIWKFTAKKTGHARLELKKVRPWNAGEHTGQRFAVDLEIGDR